MRSRIFSKISSYLTERELDLGVEEPPLAVLGERHHPGGVGAEVEAEDAARVARQLEGARHLLELAGLAELDLPHLHVGRESYN